MTGINILTLISLGLLSSALAQDCWWTGCQPNSWAVKGCAQYNREEKGRKPCSNGNIYQCCARGGGSGGGGGGGGGSGGGSGAFSITFNQFRKAVTSNGYPAPSKTQFKNFVRHAKSEGKITTLQEAAMALAQLLHESDGLRAKREYACASSGCPGQYREPSCDKAGQHYFGRGYIQLTWCSNYRAASNAIFKDDRLVRNPDSVARVDSIAWQTSFWYWGSRVHNAPGVQAGKFGASTKAINGPLECSRPGHPTPPKRFKLYGNVRKAFGLPGAGDSSGCA